jgi:hypothetical protein
MRARTLLLVAILVALLAVPSLPLAGVPHGNLDPAQGRSARVTPLIQPSTTCGAWDGNPPNGTAPCSAPISVTTGDTFVGVVALYGPQTTSTPGFTGSWWLSSVSWFENLTTSSGPELFAMKGTVTSSGSYVPVWTSCGTCDIIGWGFDFPPAIVPKLAGSGSTGSGTTAADPLSGTAVSDTLISAFVSGRPTGSMSASGTWNATVPAPNAPQNINGEAVWAWVNGAFSVPSPTFTTSNSHAWAAFSFTVGCSGTCPGPPLYGFYEKTYSLPGFDPLTGYLNNLGGQDTQIPTLSSTQGQPAGIYYVDNSSDFDILYLSNATRHAIAHVVPLYQTYASYNEMLDNEFFVEYGYDQALFFGTTTSTGTTYSIELVNLTSGIVRIWNTSASVDGTNQQPDYVGNSTVIVMSSNCSILAWNLAARTEWSAGTLGGSFGSGATCFEANNAYWFPQKEQLVNVEAHGDSGDHVEQLNGSLNGQGQLHFTSVATITVDSGVVFNWVNGLAYNASTDEIAFSSGYWVANTVYTYVVPYGPNGLITASGETRYSADNSGTPTGRLLDIQRYVYTDDYMDGPARGPSAWTNGTQLMFDPWNGSLIPANRSFEDAPCGNNCFEGQYAPTPAYQIDYNATLQLNEPMYRVVYAYHSAVSPSPSATVSLAPNSGPVGTVVTLSGSGYGTSVGYTYCFQSTAAPCTSGSTFTSTSGGTIPSGVTLSVPSSGNAYVDVSNGTQLLADAPFSVTTASIADVPTAGPVGTLVAVSGSGFAPGAGYTYCLQSTATACVSGSTFTSTNLGAVPSGLSARVTSSSTAYLIASNGTVMTADTPFVVTTATLTLTPSSGPSGTVVGLTGSGFAASTFYDLCWAPSSSPVGCPAALNFTTAANGSIPSGVTLTWTSGNAWAAISQGSTSPGFIVSAQFTPQTGTSGGGHGGQNATSLTPPTDLAAAPGSSCASETLTWTNPPSANGLVVISDSVYLSTGSGLLLEEVDLGAPAEAQTLTGLVCSLTYQAQVRAWYTGDTASPLSSNVSFLTAPIPGNTSAVSQPTVSHSVLLWLLLGFLLLAAVIVVAVVATSRQSRRRPGRQR